MLPDLVYLRVGRGEGVAFDLGCDGGGAEIAVNPVHRAAIGAAKTEGNARLAVFVAVTAKGGCTHVSHYVVEVGVIRREVGREIPGVEVDLCERVHALDYACSEEWRRIGVVRAALVGDEAFEFVYDGLRFVLGARGWAAIELGTRVIGGALAAGPLKWEIAIEVDTECACAVGVESSAAGRVGVLAL